MVVADSLSTALFNPHILLLLPTAQIESHPTGAEHVADVCDLLRPFVSVAIASGAAYLAGVKRGVCTRNCPISYGHMEGGTRSTGREGRRSVMRTGTLPAHTHGHVTIISLF